MFTITIRFFIPFFFVILSYGCVTNSVEQIARSMYNIEEVGVSDFDGTKHVRVNNIPCTGAWFDLYQDSKLSINKSVMLKIKVPGVNSIGDGKSLHFNLDGEILDFDTVDSVTGVEEVFSSQYSPGYVGGGTYVSPYYSPATRASTKQYLITEHNADQIARANKAVMRVDMKQSSVEGRCDPKEVGDGNYKSLARELSGTAGFARFIELIKTLD